MSSDLTEIGLRALQAGKKREARRLFGEAVHQNPQNAEAWWYLSRVLDEPAQKAYCLRQVLNLEPDHAEARRALASVESRVAGLTPPSGSERPIVDGVIGTDGVVVTGEETAADEAPEDERNDVVVMGIAVTLALIAMVVTIIMVTSGVATEALGIRPPEVVPTQIPLGFGVPACLASDDSRAHLVFINNTDMSIDLLRGPQGQETYLTTLEPDAQEVIETTAGMPVRYAVRTDDAAYAVGGAILEVPGASTCRVPIQ